MLQSNSLQLKSPRHNSSDARPGFTQTAQRSQTKVSTAQELEAFCESLPANLSANKRAMINRLVALYGQAALD